MYRISYIALALPLASSFCPAQTGPEPRTHPLQVVNGTGSGSYVSRTVVPIFAPPQLNGAPFFMWINRQGAHNIQNSTSNATTVTTSGHLIKIAAVYVNCKIWYPPATEPPFNNTSTHVGLFLSTDSTSPQAERREMRIQIQAEVGGSGVSIKKIAEYLAVQLDWFPEQMGLWHSEHVKFFSEETGGVELERGKYYIPLSMNGAVKFVQDLADPTKITASVWYEPQWSSQDLLPLEEGGESREPPRMSVSMKMSRILGSSSFDSGNFSPIKLIQSRLLPVELTLHRRGTINTPGAAIPRPADSNSVYEVITLENADFDEQTDWTPNSMASAGETNRQDGATEAVDMERDDDFVKIHLHAPLPQMPGSIELVMDQAGQGDRMQANDLRFHNDQGQRVLLENLEIPDLQNPQGPLAPMLQNDGLDLFVEIADLGQLTREAGQANGNQRRYADLILRLTLGGQVTEQRARIYRGGYWRNQRDGNTGTIAFYDGKGRHQDLSGAWRVDVGNLVHGPFNIQSGTGGVTDETRRNVGPTPAGWYELWERTDFRDWWDGRNRPQTDHTTGRNGQQLGYLQQGSYCQWSGPGNRTAYTHQGANPPSSIHFKFELVPWGHNAHGRTFLQIHPDGFNDGTAGCIGLQNYNDSCRVFFLLRHYFGTRLNVETP